MNVICKLVRNMRDDEFGAIMTVNIMPEESFLFPLSFLLTPFPSLPSFSWMSLYKYLLNICKTSVRTLKHGDQNKSHVIMEQTDKYLQGVCYMG